MRRFPSALRTPLTVESLEDRSVLQGENCFFQLNPFPVLPILNAGNAFVQYPGGPHLPDWRPTAAKRATETAGTV